MKHVDFFKKYVLAISIAVFLVLFIIWTSWYWLTSLLLLGFFIFLLPKYFIPIFLKIKFFYYVKIGLSFIFIFLFAIFLRVFIFEIYTIPSSSMEQTLVPGDKIIVNKLAYGPKIPDTINEVPWLNIFSFFKTNTNENTKSNDYRRLRGLQPIKRNEVVVFHRPGTDDIYVKRCVGLPGDNIKLVDEKLFVDKSPVQSPLTLKHRFCVYSNRIDTLLNYFREKHLEIRRRNSINSFIVFLTNKSKAEIENLNFIDSVKFVNQEFRNKNAQNFYNNTVIIPPQNNNIFIAGKEYKTGWTVFNFGDLYIPKKDIVIILNKKNIERYSKIITEYENHKLEIVNNKIFIDGRVRQEYQFERNYYFMLGDNRSQSLDSRYWGFVPENHIIGKAVKILFSNSKVDFSGNRFLKKIY